MKMDFLDLKVTWALRETEVRLGHLDQEEKMAQKVQKVVVVLMVTQVPLVLLEKRENLESQDYRVILEDKVQRVL